jgi:photosystem II stability/assembly factor-like uncharacterized protein
MKKENSKLAEKLTTYLFYASILFFLIAFNFQDNKTSGWYQQFLPNPLGGQIKDIYFVDSLLGFAVSDSCILKTTNGGDNWSIKLYSTFFTRIKFLDNNTGIASDAFHLHKTTNSGENWTTLILPGDLMAEDMSVLNKDTIWICNHEGLVGGAFLTTDGGLNWQVKTTESKPYHIYMYNARIGFIDNGFKKTTDGGNNWFSISGEGNFTDMYFIDSLTGWKTSDNGIMKKTINGGLNWITQTLPTGGNIFGAGASKIMKVNKDTIWSVGDAYITGGSPPVRGILFRTTNSGSNWGYQLPDTSIHITSYYLGQFINKRIGWAYHVNPTGIHTLVGGDTTFVMSTQNISTNIPDKYKLEQNYPNPFNSMTNVKVQMLKQGFAEIKVFDITGKLIKTLIKQNLSSGEHKVLFNAVDLMSGVYFYTLFVDGVRVDTKKAILIK